MATMGQDRSRFRAIQKSRKYSTPSPINLNRIGMSAISRAL